MVTERQQSMSGGEWKLPPRIKVFEALGAIADGRVELTGDGARVVSSDGSRVYVVKFDKDRWAVGSTDNGSTFKSYYGYPIIALLMMKGLLPYREDIARALKGIPWRELNERYKRYWLVEKVIIDRLRERGLNEKEIKEYLKTVMEGLKRLRLGRIELGQRTLF